MSNQLDSVKLYKSALRIRMVEERIATRYAEGKMRCPVHLSVGQELPSALFEQVSREEDTAVSTHRAHAHYLAKGGNLPKMIAEIYGKITGCSAGRGGSMHLIDLEKGFLGSSAIVGNSIPVGVGVGYANQLNKNTSLSFIFMGDGAVEEGVFYESANFAAVHKLPVVFICENNLYSVYTNLDPRQPRNRSIATLAENIGLNSVSLDLENLENTFKEMNNFVSQARLGNGPAFIEISTYRKLEHCGPNDDDNLGYRPSNELEYFKENDRLMKLEENLIETGFLDIDGIEKMKKIHSEEIDNAFAFAESSRFPTIEEALQGTYA